MKEGSKKPAEIGGKVVYVNLKSPQTAKPHKASKNKAEGGRAARRARSPNMGRTRKGEGGRERGGKKLYAILGNKTAQGMRHRIQGRRTRLPEGDFWMSERGLMSKSVPQKSGYSMGGGKGGGTSIDRRAAGLRGAKRTQIGERELREKVFENRTF